MSDNGSLLVNEAAESVGVWPFFFADEIRDWQVRAQRNQVLWGGRGTGKSVFLKVAAAITSSSTTVSGREDWERALDALQEYGRRGTGMLFIDDLDRLVFRSRASRNAADELQRAIELAVQRARVNGCLVTSTLPLDEVIFPSDAASLFFQPIHEFKLRWWAKDWTQIIGVQLTEQKLHDRHAVLARLGESLFADELTGLIELTGGHPALFGVGIHHMIERTDTISPCGKVTPGSRDVLLAYLEAYLQRNAMGRVRKLLQALESGGLDSVGMPADVQRRAWEAIRELARLPPGEGMQLPMKVAQTLERTGLVAPYSETFPETWGVPSPLLRAEIAPEERKPVVAAVPSRDLPHNQGTLVVVTSSDTIQVILSGAPWRVVRVLVARMPETVPISSLMEAGEFSTSLALRSALKRLRDDLAKFGVDGVVRNDWGAGYRIAPLEERSAPPRATTP
jgi:hypothetical protein